MTGSEREWPEAGAGAPGGGAVRETASIAFCAWHEAYSNTARPVRDSSGARLFACLSCRQAYDLVPIADQP